MRVAVTGSTGMLGAALTHELAGSGHEVVRLVRGRVTDHGQRHWNPDAGRIDAPGLSDVDAVVNLAGAPVVGGRWTRERKAELRRSRISSTLTIVTSLEPDGRCQRLLNASAVGYYGNTGIEVADEQSPNGQGFLAGLCRDWEAAARHSAVPIALLRTGLVLAPDSGLLGNQRPLFALGLGGRLGNGRQFVSWISLADHIRAMLFLLTSDLTGPFNLTAPNPVTNAALTRAFGRFLNRPTLMPTPLLPLRALFGNEFVNDALLSSSRAIPARLQAAGFKFQHTHISHAFAAMQDE